MRRTQRLALAMAAVWSASGGFATAETTLRLSSIGPANVRAGRPVRLEIRADLDRSLTAVTFDLSTSGDSSALLTARSADATAENGLTYVSAIEQIAPFESGLPHDFSKSPVREVLLHFGDPPFDGVFPAENALVAWVDMVPTRGGRLVIHLTNPQAASTQWHPDGIVLTPLTIDPKHASVTLDVTSLHDSDIDGDIDLLDFDRFQACFSGSGVAPGDEACLSSFDGDEDGDIDQTDFAGFHAVFTAPSTAVAATSGGRGVADRNTSALGASDEDADATGDEVVNDEDLVFVRQRLGLDVSEPGNGSADANADGFIDLLDLIFVRNRIGETTYGRRSSTPDLRMTELNILAGEGPFWVELTHVGTGMLDTGPFYLSNQQGGFNYNLGVLPDSLRLIPPGFRLVISFDGPAEPTWIGDEADPDGAIVHVAPPFNPPDPQEDACRLHLLDFASLGPLVDRVAWGGPEQVDSVLNPLATPVPAGSSIGRDGYEDEIWRVYTTPTPGHPNGMAPPEPYFPYPGLEFDEGDSIRFTWIDVRYGELQYRLQVAGAAGFDAPVVDELVPGTLFDTSSPLPAGLYTWRVRIEAGEFVSDWSDVATFSILPVTGTVAFAEDPSAAQLSSVTLEWFRQNPLPLPRKDTKLLCLECKHDTFKHAWDAVHPVAVQRSRCEHAVFYGPLSVIAAINHYYGGSVLLDQMSLMGDRGDYPARVKFFGHSAGAGGPALQRDILRLVLGFESKETVIEEVSLVAGRENSIDNVLRDGRPIMAYRQSFFLDCEAVSKSAKPLIVFGYHPATDSRPERFEALDPNLGYKKGLNFTVTAPVSQLGCAYALTVPPTPGVVQPLQADPEMSRDTDGDGVMDYDENNRFFTLVEHRDSDSDGIDDKTEIFSYQFGKGRIQRKPDIDGDNLRAEVDADGDNDGCPDGEEDKNRNGHFIQKLWSVHSADVTGHLDGLKPAPREPGESDPYFKDAYDLKLTPGRTHVAFGKSVPIEVTLQYNDTSEKKQGVKDARVELLVMDDQYRGDLADSEVTIDKYGRAETSFTAGGDISGDVELKAIYRPCKDAVAQWEAVVRLTIAEVDWMFVIQTKAVLTQSETLHLGSVEVFLPTPLASGRVIRRPDRFKDAGYQRIEGFFDHPDVENPGRHIDSISIQPSYSNLYINGVLAKGGTWTRSNEEEEPKSWRIEIAQPNAYPRDLLPRSLFVRGEGFQIYAPLVTWAAVTSAGPQVRDFVYRGDDTWKVLSYEYTSQSATFYFGDGESGWDPGSNKWPANRHTEVSFIPVGTVAGYNVGHFQSDGWWDPLDWPSQSGDAAFTTNVFGLDKNDIQIIAPFTWSVLTRSASSDSDAVVADALRQEVENLPRLNPPPLLDDIVFERDYLAEEQDELEQRGLDPPQYFITMRSQE